MRTALLPTPGDPFMLAYWLRNFETWRDEVDSLVVLVNGQQDDEVVGLLRDMVAAVGGKMMWFPQRIGHDGAMRWVLENGDSEHVVLCEDDAYVRKPGEVARAFRRIENGLTDIVGSPRHEDYASSPLMDWDVYMPGDLRELRHGLWPAFLFARRADLLNTDRVYGDRRWNIGEEIAGWGKVDAEACALVGIAPDYVHLDTLFGTTFQLRANSLEVELIHHVRLFDAAATEQWIAEDPPWFHVTGLSTLDYILDGRTDIPDRGLWERRISWWMRAGVFSTPERTARLVAFIREAGVNGAEIGRWTERFDAWAETAVPV